MKEVGEDFREPLVGNQLVGTRVEGGGAYSLPILHRGGESFGKGGGNCGAALAAATLLGQGGPARCSVISSGIAGSSKT